MTDVLLEMKNIVKIYPNGVVANDNINLSLKKGEIHALLGENGAGKSTLMKILFGIETPESGEIILNGKKINVRNPLEAIKLGIGMVHQHFMLVPSFTIAENIILGVEPKKGVFTDIDKAEELSGKIAREYNFNLDVREKVENLPVGIKQKVEILKALYRGADILILDEPTAVLTPQETEELFIQLRKLKDKGHTIIFISHKLDEIKEICDRLTIMRNGKNMGTYETSDLTTKEISRLMVGRDVVTKFDKSPLNLRELAVRIRDLEVWNSAGTRKVNRLSFDVKEGEILGIAGVEGNGQSELAQVLAGLIENYKGEYSIFGSSAKGMSIKDLREKGMSYIPEDRMTYGIAENMDLLSNLFANQYDKEKYSGKVFLKKKPMEQSAKELISHFLIKAGSFKTKVGMLSGGNIQKVVVAREFSDDPKVIIANQPTRGIDVGAAEFIRKKLLELRDRGCAIILISADLNEVMELSDRLAVMYKGEFSGVFKNVSSLTEEELGRYMLGIEKDEGLEGIVYA